MVDAADLIKEHEFARAKEALTRADYERDVKQWVDDHQRPTTNAENEKVLREKMTELRGDQP